MYKKKKLFLDEIYKDIKNLSKNRYFPKSLDDKCNDFIKDISKIENNFAKSIFSFNALVRQLGYLFFLNQGHNPDIFKSIERNDLKAVQYLIENGFSHIDDTNENGITALEYCNKRNKKEIYDYLLHLLADYHKKDIDLNIFKACKEGNLLNVQYLIEVENFDENKKLDQYDEELRIFKDQALIHIACEHGHLNIVQYLIGKIGVDVNSKGCWEKTPIQFACERNHAKIIEYLLSNGAKLDTKDIYGNSLIHYASIGGVLSIVQELIEKQKVDKDIQGYFKQTPLYYACWNNHPSLVQYLISNGANIEARDENNWTPLHWASNFGAADIVKDLVAIGADTESKDNDGNTPYDLAKNDIIQNILLGTEEQKNKSENSQINSQD